MCNHTVDPKKVSARWVCTMRYDGGGVSLVAAAGGRGEVGGEDLKEGDELLLSYGPRLAEELLHVYGFLPVRRRKMWSPPFVRSLATLTRSIYQDRLRTNIGRKS